MNTRAMAAMAPLVPAGLDASGVGDVSRFAPASSISVPLRLVLPRRVLLVLSGGGRNYVALAGAVQRLQDLGVEVVAIAGVSAGAIVAALVAARRDRLPLWDLIRKTLPGSKIPLSRRLMPWRRPYGMYGGSELVREFERRLVPAFGVARMPLAILTAQLGVGQVWWSSWLTPEEEIARTVRASMAVPGLFTPVLLDGHWHVDGGLASNFPLDDVPWPQHLRGEAVLGLKVNALGGGGRRSLGGLLDYLGAVVDTAIRANEREDIEDVKSPWISVDVVGDSLDLEVTVEDARVLWQLGRQAVDDWVRTRRRMLEVARVRGGL